MLKYLGIGLGVVLCLLLVGPASTPVQLSYVYSESMEPTISQYDGYVLVPAGDIESGEIVSFWSESKNTYVTHRIVGQSSNGFITKGDNNPTTDQAAGDPYVQRDDIVGQVVTLNGSPVTIPHLGRAARFIHANWKGIAGVLGLLLLGSTLRNNRSTRPSRSITRVRDVLLPLLVITFVSAVGLQVIGATSQQLEYVAVLSDNPASSTVTVGETATRTVEASRSAIPGTTNVLSVDGATVVDQSRDATTIRATIRIHAPASTGPVTPNVVVNQYPAVFPVQVLQSLQEIHPIIASTVTTFFVMSPLYVLYWLAIDGNRPIRSTENRWTKQLAQKFNRL